MSQVKPIEQIKTGNVKRWVKASEVLPKEDGLYNARYRDEPVIIRVREGVIDRLTFASGGVFPNTSQATLVDTEWLDESAPDQSSQIKLLQEQIRKQEEEMYKLRDSVLWMSRELSRLNDITGQDNRIEEQLCLVHEILNGELPKAAKEALNHK
jgi:hypothetical protein